VIRGAGLEFSVSAHTGNRGAGVKNALVR
jgi:hypothetical protein